jgi:hypothetical protein
MTHTRHTGRGAARAANPRPLPIRWALIYSIQAAASPHLIREQAADGDPTNDRSQAFRLWVRVADFRRWQGSVYERQ